MLLTSAILAALTGILTFSFYPNLFTWHPIPAPPSRLLSSQTTQYIESIRSKYRVQGISLSVVSIDAGITETVSFGVANTKEEPVTEESMFDIASNSKLFTVFSIGLLIKNDPHLPNGRKLDWSTKIIDILPDWKLMDEYASDHADIIDIMSKRIRAYKLMSRTIEPNSTLHNVRYLRPSTELRKSWQYNNHLFVAISQIIPVLTGIPFADFVTSHIFKPLGMKATFEPFEAKASGRLTNGFGRSGQNRTRCAETWKAGSTIDEACVGEAKGFEWYRKSDGRSLQGASTGLLSGRDMAIWLRELLDPKIIPKDLIAKIAKPVIVMKPIRFLPHSPNYYGLAQFGCQYRGYEIVGHIGDMPGQNSITLRIPEQRIGFFLAMNEYEFGGPIKTLLAYRPSILPHPPKDARSPPAEQNIVGKYLDEAYGHLKVVSARHLKHQAGPVQSILRNHPQGPINPDGPIYLASLDIRGDSSIVFTHFDGTLFNWTLTEAYPVLDEKGVETGEVVVHAELSGTAAFTPTGIGLFGGWWGDVTGERKRPVEESVEEEAETWFRRV